ncbi:MAG TPA: YihY/virulence factor BrkB family protein [Verrucomicrobiae bacterium]|nr:YihY/virulence factor BrkB family protein [Verrucomicrobiae bacterium]
MFVKLFNDTLKAWTEHSIPRLGAALAFYTIFAIAPLFIIVLAVAGFFFGEQAAQRHLFNEVNGLIGQKSGEAIQAVIVAANQPKAGTWATVIALGTLFIGATGVFVQLQDSLNTIWNVRPKPGGGLRHFIRNRLLSFAMILVLGFLLLVSLVLSAALATVGQTIGGALSTATPILEGLNFILSLAVVSFLFALIFKMLPDVKVAWRDVWIGAVMTAVLFNVGKFALGLYLGRSTFASAYGAAGSLVIFLVWVYYSSQILFFGAEFTRLYATRMGSQVEPANGAQFVTVKEIKADKPQARSGIKHV